jgi:3-isopropylmalate/(R)-2-methylmalate dehydratase small subunit
MKQFGGKVLFLDKTDINTDEIIPAKYLTEITKEALKPYLLEDLKLDGFNQKSDIQGKGVVISRTNFGCGSSREHAPWALEVNGIHVVIAESYARIFRQNMFNCGMLAIELPKDTIDRIFKSYKGKDVSVQLNLENSIFEVESEGKKEKFSFTLSKFDEALVKAGGWLEYADSHY